MWPEVRPLRRTAAKSVSRKQLRAAELGHAQTVGVARRGRAQSAQGDPPDLRPLVLQRLVVVELPAHHVRIEARAADVLADAVDHQHVHVLKRQPRHQPLGQREQFPFAGRELLGPHRLDPRRLVVGVLDDGQPGQDMAAGEHFAGHAADDLIEAEILDRAVIDLRPLALAQPDQEHLHQSAFDLAGRSRCAASRGCRPARDRPRRPSGRNEYQTLPPPERRRRFRCSIGWGSRRTVR